MYTYGRQTLCSAFLWYVPYYSCSNPWLLGRLIDFLTSNGTGFDFWIGRFRLQSLGAGNQPSAFSVPPVNLMPNQQENHDLLQKQIKFDQELLHKQLKYDQSVLENQLKFDHGGLIDAERLLSKQNDELKLPLAQQELKFPLTTPDLKLPMPNEMTWQYFQEMELKRQLEAEQRLRLQLEESLSRSSAARLFDRSIGHAQPHPLINTLGHVPTLQLPFFSTQNGLNGGFVPPSIKPDHLSPRQNGSNPVPAWEKSFRYFVFQRRHLCR